MMTNSPPLPGQPFAEVNIATDRNRILQYYLSHGYLSASFRYQTTLDAEVTRHAYGMTLRREASSSCARSWCLGLDVTRPELVEKELAKIKPGEPISTSQISEASRKLSDLGAFASVNTAMQDPSGNDQYKYVLFDFDEANRYTFNVGVGLEVGQFGQTTNSCIAGRRGKGSLSHHLFRHQPHQLFRTGSNTLSPNQVFYFGTARIFELYLAAFS